ncbi:MAG: preprotein translocase subunit YajC [Oscillospiraceae bacterium]|jgi:preprotein translocase subunit YajC
MQNYLLQTAPGGGDLLSMMLTMVLIFGLMYFMMIRPQKKREKENQAMRNALEVGDEIVTIGGILGRVVSTKDETVLIESGSANTKLRVTKSAIQANLTAQEKARERAAAQAQATQAAKEEKARAKAEAKKSKKSE